MTEKQREALLQAGVAAGAGVLALPVLCFHFGFDQAIYATIADVMSSGGRPYIDAWEMRPPAVFYFYRLAFALFGRNEWAIRVFDLVALIATAPALYRIGRDAFQSRWIGAAAAWLAPVLYVAFGYWDTSQPESYMIPLLSWGLWGWLRGERPLAAGLFLGTAILFKHSIVLVPLAMALLLFRRDRKSSLWFAGGVAAPVALLFIVALASGWLVPMLREVTGYASHHATTNWRLGPVALGRLFWFRLGLGISPIALAVAGAGAFAGWRREELRVPTRRVLFLGLVALLTIVAQAKFFVYQFLPLVPFLALLAGLALAWPRRAVAVAALAIMAGSTLWHSRESWSEVLHPGRPNQIRAGDKLYQNCSAISAQVRDRTARAEPIFIWGNAPHVYFLSDRRPATRYPILVPAVVPWVGEARVDEIVAKLRAAPPYLILTVNRDALRDISLRSEDSEQLIRAYPAFADFLKERYEAVGSLNRFTLWKRR